MNNLSEKISKVSNATVKSALQQICCSLQTQERNILASLNSTSWYDLMKAFGVYIQHKYVLTKRQNHANPLHQHQEIDRQQWYSSCIEAMSSYFTENKQLTTQRVANSQGITNELLDEFVTFIFNKGTFSNFVDFLVHDKWTGEKNGNELRLQPNEAQVKDFVALNTCAIGYKGKLKTVYASAFAKDILYNHKDFAKILFAQPLHDFFDFVQNLSEDNAEAELDRLKQNFSKDANFMFLMFKNIAFDDFITLFSEEAILFADLYLTDQPTLKDGLKIEIMYKSTKTELNMHYILKLAVAIKHMARIKLDFLSKSMQKADEEDPMLESSIYQELNLKALMNRHNPTELEKIGKEFHQRMPEIEAEVNRKERYKPLEADNFILEFGLTEFKELLQMILCFETQIEIEQFVDIFKYEPNIKDASLRYQALIVVDDKVLIYPYSWAYTVQSEMLYENLLAKNMINLHQFQTDVSEVYFNNLLQNANVSNFVTIPDDKEKKKLINPSEPTKPKGDLDIFGLEKQTMKGIHFEQKLTSNKDNIKSLITWRKGKLEDAGNRQIPNVRKYITDFPQEINRKMRVSDGTPLSIDNIKSFIISNNFAYDGLCFNGYLKTNLLNLFVLLTDAEDVLEVYEKKDYLRIWIRRITKKGGVLIPEHCKDYLIGKELSKSDEVCIENFVRYHKWEFWKDKNNKTMQELIDSIENNVVFDYLDFDDEAIVYQPFELAGFTIYIPQIEV